MIKTPKSFVMMLRRRYRVYFNPQGHGWYVAYNDGTKRQRRSIGAGTRPEAEAAVRTLDEPPTASEQAKYRASWPDVLTGYLQHKGSLDRASGTLECYKRSLQAFGGYLASLKVQYVDEVTLGNLEGFKQHRIKRDQCDPSTAYHDAITVKGAFKWAAKASRGYLTFNPALDWETPKPVKPKRKTYTLEEVEKLEGSVRELLRPIVTVLAWSGLRISELVNLRWQDIDLERRLIHIRVQEAWKPKGKRDRVVPMHPKVEAAIRNQPLGTYVFSYRAEKQALNRTVVLRWIKAEQEKLGMDVSDLHAFRRFFATTMIRRGVDAETVRQWGGWKSFNTMLRYLADVNSTDSVKAMDAAAKYGFAEPEKSDKEMTKKLA